MRIEGYIYDNLNKPVTATLLILDGAGNAVTTSQIPAGVKYWADYPNARELTFVFSAQGFTTQKVTGAELLDHGSNIHLEKSNTLLLLAMAAGLAYAFSRSKRGRGVGKLQGSDLTPVILIGGGLLAINMVSKLFDKLGLGGNPATAEITNPNSAFNPNFWKQYGSFTYAINESQAKEFSETIHNAFTVFNDDFNAIMGVFNQLRTKSNVSFLSDIFTRNYSESLLTFLTDGGGILPWDGLSKEHLSQILSYVQKLPDR